MAKYLYGVLAVAMIAACSKEAPESSSVEEVDSADVESGISGPFPKTIRGTVGSSYPLEDGSGHIYLSLLEYDNAAIIVSTETYDAKGMEEDDAEVSLQIEPMSSDQCGDVEQCFRGY